MQTVTQKYVVDAEMLRPHPLSLLRLVAGRPGAASGWNVSSPASSSFSSYESHLHGSHTQNRLYVHIRIHVDCVPWKNRRETTT